MKTEKMSCESCAADFDCEFEKVGKEHFVYPEFYTIFDNLCNPFCSKTCKDIFDNKPKITGKDIVKELEKVLE